MMPENHGVADSKKKDSKGNMEAMRKETKRQLWIFLLLCLPVTWGLMGISFAIDPAQEGVPVSVFLLRLGCFMPAIAAVFASVITKESILQLGFFPRFWGNGRVYFFAIAGGVALSCLSELLACLFFPGAERFMGDVSITKIIFTVMLYTALGCLQFFVLMGEELGWMGWLFPKIEKLFGTTGSLLLTGVIRGCWHLVMLGQKEHFFISFFTLCISNILLQSVLVLLTKASGSVVPAAVTHALTNVVPGAVTGYMVVDEMFYEAHYAGIYLTGMIPQVLIGGSCYWILMKKYRVRKYSEI